MVCFAQNQKPVIALDKSKCPEDANLQCKRRKVCNDLKYWQFLQTN